MALRVLSRNKARVIGADGIFRGRPASIIAARQFAILDVSPDTDYKLRINDTVTRIATTIRWAGTGPIFHEEIPFMVIWDVPEPRSIPRRPTRRAKRPARRRAARRRRSR